MRIPTQLELVLSIFWRMLNTLQATSNLQHIDSAPLTMSLNNSATEFVDICRIRDYSALSIGLRLNNISIGSYLLPNLESFWLEHQTFESTYLVHYPVLRQFLPQFWDGAKIRIIDLLQPCYKKNWIWLTYQRCKLFISNNDSFLLVH